MAATRNFQKHLLQSLQHDVQVNGTGLSLPLATARRWHLFPGVWGPHTSIHLPQGQFQGVVFWGWAGPRQASS